MTLRTPLSRSLAAALEREILSGHWRAGERLPTEREMAARASVSRQTLRDALDELERAGLIIRRQGSGTYVAARRLEQSLLGHFSIVDAIRSSGGEITTELLSQTTVPALPAVAATLSVDPEAPVLELERLRLVDGAPLMLERTWLPVERIPGIEEISLADASLYAVLREQYEIALVRATESFEPVLLRAREAEALAEQVGQPALMLFRTTYDEDDRAIEAARAVLRGDRCRTLVERRIHEPEPRARRSELQLLQRRQ
jgi:GntR family transcriptional regulator